MLLFLSSSPVALWKFRISRCSYSAFEWVLDEKMRMGVAGFFSAGFCDSPANTVIMTLVGKKLCSGLNKSNDCCV